MEMTDRTIVDKYTRLGVSITTLAQLNATSNEQIEKILRAAGVELPARKKTKQEITSLAFEVLDSIDEQIKQHTKQTKERDHELELLETQYKIVVEYLRTLNEPKRKRGGK